LGISGAVAGLLIVAAWQLTLPTITRNTGARLQAAVEEVLAGPASFDTLYVAGDALTADQPAQGSAEQVYVGYAADGRVVGFAIAAAQPGFADIVRLIFGYDAANQRLLGIKVLENKETPGLGDKIEKDTAFTGQFGGAATPLRGVKAGRATGDPHEIDMITGATISSRVVVRIVNDALARFDPLVAAWLREASR
jgi:electron transport complex protein RnfG